MYHQRSHTIYQTRREKFPNYDHTELIPRRLQQIPIHAKIIRTKELTNAITLVDVSAHSNPNHASPK